MIGCLHCLEEQANTLVFAKMEVKLSFDVVILKETFILAHNVMNREYSKVPETTSLDYVEAQLIYEI
jgi:hypothetical protein